MKKLLFLLFIWFSAGSYFDLFSQITDVEKTCTNTACHGDVVKEAIVHSPVNEDCEYCHVSTGEKHPQNNVKGFSLTEKTPMLCYMCHEEKNSKHHVHYPVQEGDCMSCHTPHSSASASLLNAESPSKLCSECHDLEMEQHRVKHMPVSEGECTDCHHPHQSDFSSLLTERVPNLCFQCHENVGESAAHIHVPYTEDCLSCHNAHSSNENHLTRQSLPDLCYMCHEDIKEDVEKAALTHKAVYENKSCTNCHSPHASSEHRLLLAHEKELCLNCHNKVFQKGTRQIDNIKNVLQNSNFVHAAIEEGCVICHKPHASSDSSLLAEAFPHSNYTTASSDNFALCFSCHDSELLVQPQTTTATNFRDGDRNLHYLHINGKKGRNCNMCHNMHGSNNEHLIETEVQFGNWQMPVHYTVQENGGACSTGCHGEKKYVR